MQVPNLQKFILLYIMLLYIFILYAPIKAKKSRFTSKNNSAKEREQLFEYYNFYDAASRSGSLKQLFVIILISKRMTKK